MTARTARGSTGFRIVIWGLVLLGGLLGTELVRSQPASAHAVLVSSIPADGSRVNTQPAQVRLTFDEPVGLIPAAEQILSITGRRADTGHAYLAQGGTTIVLTLKPHLPHGSYSATWRVVSADTHVVSGSITFGLGVMAGTGPSAPAGHTGQLDVAASVAQALVYAGVVLLLGVSAVVRLLWPWALRYRRIRVLAWAGWTALLTGTAGLFLLQGPRADNLSWAAVGRLAGAYQTADSSFGRQLFARAGLLLLVVPLLTRRGQAALPGRAGDLTRVAAAFAILATVAVTGHEAAGPTVWLALPSAVLHLGAMALWLGGLVVLGMAVVPAVKAGQRTLAGTRLPRWSVTAYVCVVCLVVSGEYQASRQISPIQALWSTRYGFTLLIKIGLVAVMVAAAYLAYRRIPGPADGPVDGGETLRAVKRTVGIETAVAVLVLAVTAALVSDPPARTTYGPAVTMSAPLGADHVSVHVDTTRRGPQAIAIDVVDPAGSPVQVRTASAMVSSATVPALNLVLRKVTPDGSQWATTAAVIPLPGIWTLTLNIGLGEADAYTTSASYRVW